MISMEKDLGILMETRISVMVSGCFYSAGRCILYSVQCVILNNIV